MEEKRKREKKLLPEFSREELLLALRDPVMADQFIRLIAKVFYKEVPREKL